MEADGTFEGSVGLEHGPAFAGCFVHLVVALPGELDIAGVATAVDLPSDAAESKFTRAVFPEEDIGRLHHVGEIIFVAWHLDNAPAAEHAHVGAARILGSRTRL